MLIGVTPVKENSGRLGNVYDVVEQIIKGINHGKPVFMNRPNGIDHNDNSSFAFFGYQVIK